MRVRRIQGGFTLIELLTVITVLAVLSAIAIPSFRSSMASSRLTTTTNGYISALNQARSEAVRRNTSVQVCGSTATANGADTLGTGCNSDPQPMLGQVYVIDPGTGTAVKVADLPPLPPHISASNDGGDVPALRYGGQGMAHATTGSAPYNGLVLDLSSDQLSANNHRCVYLLTGSAVSSCPSSTACPTSEPANCQ